MKSTVLTSSQYLAILVLCAGCENNSSNMFFLAIILQLCYFKIFVLSHIQYKLQTCIHIYSVKMISLSVALNKQGSIALQDNSDTII